ncbi:MAG: DUF1697 domain-containing protein [Bryobacteraceae bacterium]|jgi:uncharacterized protein (DUF1697 family)
MPVLISLLRGVNVGGHHKVKMDDLRAIYESLGCDGVQTFINSGNVIFKTAARDLARLRSRIEDAIESACGFRSDVMLRTPSDLRGVIASNPFAARPGIDASRLAIHFLAADPSAAAREQVLAIDAAPEELHVAGRELYIYYPNGMGRPKLSLPLVERTLRTSGTSRNWNTVRKLLEMAEKLES